MKKNKYKEMLTNAVEAWLRGYPYYVEDHHAISDVEELLKCDKKFAIKVVRIIAQRNSNLIKDTGLGLHRDNEVKS